MALSSWVEQTQATYLGNATAVRDYRVQLRGNRSAILFGVYLVLLIGASMTVYSSIEGNQNSSIAEVQYRLHDFYQMILSMLGVMVVTVCPALSATAIVMERQRQSLDLIFSAPVTPKYYLVGKMISSFRYTWMLLALSLPITASCVVLGGATWSDVLTAYALLSMHGLVITSIALLLSTITTKPVSAVLWSYIATAAYTGITVSVVGTTASMAFRGIPGAINPLIAMNPFTVIYAVGTYSNILGYHVPNWALAIVMTALICKFFLLAAGAKLSPYGGKETPSLRIHAIVYIGAILFITAYSAAPSVPSATISTWTPTGPGPMISPASFLFGSMMCWALVALSLLLPQLSCYGMDAEHRFRPNGIFSVGKILNGSPAGALPYVLSLVLTVFAAMELGAHASTDRWLPAGFFAYAAFGTAFLFFFWSIGRLASSYLVSLKVARTAQFVALITLAVFPVPILTSLSTNTKDMIWDLYILRPLVRDLTEDLTAPIIYGIILFSLGAALTLFSELNLRRNQKERANAAANFSAA